jgi:hypothetical protein
MSANGRETDAIAEMNARKGETTQRHDKLHDVIAEMPARNRRRTDVIAAAG